MEGFTSMLEKLLPDPEEQSAALSELNQYRSKIGLFGKQSVRAYAKNAAAHEWWQACGAAVPHLQQVAMRVLAQPASACSCERNWSTFGFIHRPIRNRLLPERASKLVYVFSNLRILKKCTSADYERSFPMWPDSDDE